MLVRLFIRDDRELFGLLGLSKIDEQRELKAELISMKFKTARADSARNVLAGAKFRVCPNCGRPISSHRVASLEGSLALVRINQAREFPFATSLVGTR